jgi:hypothetical protein
MHAASAADIDTAQSQRAPRTASECSRSPKQTADADIKKHEPDDKDNAPTHGKHWGFLINLQWVRSGHPYTTL